MNMSAHSILNSLCLQPQAVISKENKLSNQLSVAYNEYKTILCFDFTMYPLKLFYQMNYFDFVYDKPLNSCIIIINIYRRCFDDCVHVVLIVVLDRQDKIDAY